MGKDRPGSATVAIQIPRYPQFMGLIKARSDLKTIKRFAILVPMYADALDTVERLLHQGAMHGPGMHGPLPPALQTEFENAQHRYIAARAVLNTMINRASQITRDRGLTSPYAELLVAPADYETYLMNRSALPQNIRLVIKDTLDQTEAACQEHVRSETWNFFNPLHHLANLIRLILHPLASLLGTHFETLIKIATPALGIGLVIWVLRLFNVNFDIKDILPLLKHAN